MKADERNKMDKHDTPEPNGLRVGVSISRKLNMGNYESAEVWLSITGIEVGTTQDEIQAALATGALGYDALKVAIVEKIHDQRKKADPTP